MTTPQQAYEALNTLISYGNERGMELYGDYVTDEGLINLLKPYLKVLNYELCGEINKSDLHTTLKFTGDGKPGHWKCKKCGNRQDFGINCRDCGRKVITMANGKNNYSLIE